MSVLMLFLDSTGEGAWTEIKVPEALDDLDGLVGMLQFTLSRLPEDDPDRPEVFGRLGDLWLIRYERASGPNDLRNAILLYQQAMQTTPSDDSSAEEWHQKLKHASDNLDTSISIQRQVLDRTSEDDSQLPMLLDGLAIFLGTRWERFWEVNDLNDAIFAQRRALELTSGNDPEMLANLGNLLFVRFKRLGDPDDYGHAILAQRRALELTPEGDSNMLQRLNSLKKSLKTRLKLDSLREISDIDSAIEIAHRALNLTPEGHPDRSENLGSLGLFLYCRFKHVKDGGDLGVLDSAISAQRRAVELTPEGHPDMPKRLRRFGDSVKSRFDRLGVPDDLETAVQALRRALELAPEGDPDMPKYYKSRASSLAKRFWCLGGGDDIEEAISLQRCLVKLTPEGGLEMSLCLSDLGVYLYERFVVFQKIEDLEGAISAHKRALLLIPEGSPHMPMCLRDLAISLSRRFKCLKKTDDFDSAVSMLRRALTLIPKHHLGRLRIYQELGNTFWYCFQIHKNQHNFQQTAGCYMNAYIQTLGRPSERLASAITWATFESGYREYGASSSFLCAHAAVMNALPRVVWLGHSIARRYQESARVAEHVNNAVSAAIELNQLPLALKWLETGRGLVWSQISSLRAPVDDLSRQHPDLAKEWQVLSSELQLTHLAQLPEITPLEYSFMSDQADQHRAIVAQYEACLKKIRACPGFQRFSDSFIEVDIHQMLEAGGPVVFVNVSSSRCDALVISRRCDGLSSSPGPTIDLVPLPNLTQLGAKELRLMYMSYLQANKVRHRMPAPSSPPDEAESDQILKVLDRLWSSVVYPILKALGLIRPCLPASLKPNPAVFRCGSELPQITWCPTGPLAQLPLHAAGAYPKFGASGPHVYDFVVSSYTPSLSALVRARKGVDHSFSYALTHGRDVAWKPPPPNVLIVTQPNTPSLSRLPGTVDEGTRLQTILSQYGLERTVFDGDEATVDCVEESISRFPWVHFACHGVQHPSDPTKSAFSLHDNDLPLSTLMRTVADGAELAFLSACQTATGDENAPEESAHLTAGMLAVGFKGVIGTMWSIGDADAPVVVEAYYKKLLELRRTGYVVPGTTGAAQALHEAVKVLREKVGEKRVLRWAPFVHYGI